MFKCLIVMLWLAQLNSCYQSLATLGAKSSMNCKIREITEDDEIGRIVNRDFTDNFVEKFVLIGDDETCLPAYFENYTEAMKNFEVRNSDVIVASFPKAGTTWMQEMVWLIANNLDYAKAEVSLHERFPYFELGAIYDFSKLEKTTGGKFPKWTIQSIDFINNLDSPRFIKTHLPFSLLPAEIQDGSKTPKIIYVMRNPKDVCVSYFHHGKLLEGWRANFKNFSKAFLAGKVLFGPYWKNVLGYWNLKNSQNLLIVKYEDMKENLPDVVRKVARFLNKNLTEDQEEILCSHLSFESMKKNRAVNFQDIVEANKLANPSLEGSFMRSGTVGKFRQEMSPEMIEEFDEWIDENVAGTSFGEEIDYKL